MWELLFRLAPEKNTIAKTNAEKKKEDHRKITKEETLEERKPRLAIDRKRHSRAGTTQRTNTVSMIQRRFPRPRKTGGPW
jgi:hypothetical protein